MKLKKRAIVFYMLINLAKSAHELERDYENLCKEYDNTQEKISDLEKFKVDKLKEYISKEQEYRDIIEKLTKKLRPDGAYSNADYNMKMDEIREMHSKIIDNISLAQMRTSKVLLDQEKSIIQFYNKKINDLTKQFQEENLRQQKRHKDFRQKEENLLSELEWIKGIAHKIDIENFYLVKRHLELKVEYETQKNDRNMLIQ